MICGLGACVCIYCYSERPSIIQQVAIFITRKILINQLAAQEEITFSNCKRRKSSRKKSLFGLRSWYNAFSMCIGVKPAFLHEYLLSLSTFTIQLWKLLLCVRSVLVSARFSLYRGVLQFGCNNF